MSSCTSWIFFIVRLSASSKIFCFSSEDNGSKRFGDAVSSFVFSEPFIYCINSYAVHVVNGLFRQVAQLLYC